MESTIFKSIITALAFTTSYSIVSAQMAPQSPSNRPPQINSKSSIERSAKSGKVVTSDIPSSETNLKQNQNNFPSKKQKLNKGDRNEADDKKIKSDGSVRNDYRSKPNPKGKIKNLNTESLNQHPVPTRANDPSRDGVRIK